MTRSRRLGFPAEPTCEYFFTAMTPHDSSKSNSVISLQLVAFLCSSLKHVKQGPW